MSMQQSPRPNPFRDAWAGKLDADRAGTEARVSGWVHRRRDHGGLIFIDLRERSGILQLVFHPDAAPQAHAAAHGLRAEDVITAAGQITRRAPENINPGLPTGEIELAVAELACWPTPTRPRSRSTRTRRSTRTCACATAHWTCAGPAAEAIALRHRVSATIREVPRRA